MPTTEPLGVMDALERSINRTPPPATSPISIPTSGRQPTTFDPGVTPEKLQQAARISADINPAVAARVLDIEKKSGLPRKYIEENLDETERAVALKSFDPMHFRANSPKFAAWLAGDPHALAVAKKDLSRMSAFEQGLALWEAGRAAADPRLTELYGKELEGGRLTSQETVEMAVLKKRQQTASQAMERAGALPWALSAGGYATRQFEESIAVYGKGALAGAATGLMATGGLGGVPAAVTGAVLGGLTAGAVHSYNLESASAFGEFKEARDVKGAPLADVQLARTAARAYGVMAAAIETGSDALLGGIAAKLMPGLNAVKQKLGVEGAKVALKQATKEMLANPTKRVVLAKMTGGVLGASGLEWSEEFAQTMLQALVGDVMKGKSDQTFAPTDWAAARSEAVSAGNQAAIGSLFIAGPAGAIGTKMRFNEVARAQETQQFFQALGETMTQSDMVKTAPDVAEAAVSAITADSGVKNVYVPVATWNALFQADARGAAQEILGDTAQYDEAMSLTGADIVIPIGKYAAKVAGTPLHEKLTPDLRLEQGGMSAREAAEAESNADKLLALHVKDAEAAAEQNKPLEAIQKEAFDMVRPFMGEREAARYALVESQRYATRAARMGIDPAELYKREAPIVKRDFAARASEAALASDTNFAEFNRGNALTLTGETWAKPGDEMAFYHGSGANITAFRPRQSGAVFLSPDPATASAFAFRSALYGSGEPGGAVYKVYASARKPFDYDNQAHVDDIAQALEGVSDRDIGAASASKALHRFYTNKAQLVDGIRNGAWGAIEHPLVQKIIKAKRYDAFWVMEGGVKNIGIYDPKMVKSATGNRGTYDTTKDNILYQADDRWYFSQLERAVAASSLTRAPAKQWLATLRKTPGVKPAELEATGLTEWLELQDGPVTREAIAEYLKQNGVQVTETMLGAPAPSRELMDEMRRRGHALPTDQDGWQELAGVYLAEAHDMQAKTGNSPETQARIEAFAQKFFALSAEADRLAEGVDEQGAAVGPKFSQWQLPGGEGYRELLLTLPIAREMPSGYRVALNPSKARNAKRFLILDEVGDRYGSGDTPGEAIDSYFENHTPAFKSSHFEQPNILAHVRFNERVDADGKRVLFIEEVQSDWAQAGRKKGFRVAPEREAELRAIIAEAERAGGAATIEQKQAWAAAMTELQPETISNKAPLAPFVTKTEAWVGLGLKRMIRYAVENGFDRVAWTTGAQQAARYDLSKQVERIEVAGRTDAATGERSRSVGLKFVGLRTSDVLLGVANDGKIDNVRGGSQDWISKDLSDVVGKDVAEKIMGMEKGTLEGVDLQVGGEGMKSFYDKIVPGVARDVLKKLGGGNLTEADITVPETFTDAGKIPAGMTRQPGFDITPTMRTAALDGMPLFQPAYHGTPHEVDAFSLDKIGTGEGAQAYGWGLYFAENPGIAAGYHERLAGNPQLLTLKLGSMLLNQRNDFDYSSRATVNNVENVRASLAEDILVNEMDFRGATDKQKFVLDMLDQRIADYRTEWPEGVKAAQTLRKELARKGAVSATWEKAPGGVYQVDIPDDAVARMLDWDKPLSEQAGVIEALKKSKRKVVAEMFASGFLDNLGPRESYGVDIGPLTGESLYRHLSLSLTGKPDSKQASETLNAVGIPGIKYLDAGSRTAQDGTRNLVVFDDKLITITHKDGKPVTQAERKAYLQKIGEGPRSTVRGQFERAPAGQRPLITLFKSANPSTIWHELSHSWLEELRRDAEGPYSTPQLKADWETVRKAAGIPELKPGEQIPRNSHEWFARGSEAYVREGNAPSLELRSVFSQFATWLKQIYKSIRQLIGEDELNPEFARVMDRLLATDEQIAAAREEAAFEATALPIDELTKAEATEYQKQVAEVKLEAEERVRAQAMNEIVRERTDWWRAEKALVTREVEAEVNTRPEYQARSWLRTGRLLDGSAIEGLEHQRLDRQALVYQYGEGTLQKLAFLYQAEGGLHPDIVAQALKYESGDEMLKAIIDSPPRREVIAAEVDRIMLERHGDMLNDGGLAERAIEAVHSDKQADLLLTELRILKRLGAVGDLTTWKAIRQLAVSVVGRKAVGDLRARHYVAAGARAGFDAERAMIEKDYTHAFDAKLQQLMNLTLVQEVTQRKAAVDKALRAWKLLDRSDERLSKSRDINIVSTARAVLANYGIGKKGESAVSYLELVQEYDPATYDDLIELVSYASAEEKPYTILSVDEFTQMQEIVDGLWQLSRNAQQSLVDGQKINRDQIKAELSAAIDAMGNKPNTRGVKQALSKMDEFKVTLLDWRAALSRVEHWVELMDGGKSGAFRKYVWQPVSEAADRYRDARKTVMQKYLDLSQQYLTDRITADKIDATEIGYTFSGRAELLGALLHTGNESNLAKLLVGGRGKDAPWGAINEDGTLDSSKWGAFIRRAQRDGILTKADYDFVQSVWDLMEELKPGAQASHREMFGYYFSEITSKAFDTPWGSYRGGYAPAVTDPVLVMDAAARADEAALRPQMTFMFPTTGKGFTKSRIENYRQPLQLNLGLVQQHIDKVLRFTHIEPRVREVSRLALDKDFRTKVASFVDPEVVTEMLVPWLERAAQQQVETPAVSRGMRKLDGFFRALRSRTGAQIMVGNLSNVLQQITGLSSAMLEVKPKYLRGSLVSYLGSPQETGEWVAAKSTFMRNRTTASVIEVQQEIDNIMLDPSKYDQVRAFATRHGYFLQQGAQNIVDLITWRGAYNQAIAEKMLEREAVRHADAAVRKTQGSFAAEDLSRFETGGATFRLFTMFYSYFNLQANLLGTQFAQAMRDGGFNAPGRLFYIYVFGLMIPAALAEGIAQAMSGDLWDDDDDDGYLDNFLSVFFTGQFKFATAVVPFVGQAVNAMVNRFNDKPYDDKISVSPAISILEAVARTPYSVYKATFDEGSWKTAIKDTLTLVGIATGLPLGVLARPLGYAADVEQGRVEPANAADYVRGLITGRGTPQ